MIGGCAALALRRRRRPICYAARVPEGVQVRRAAQEDRDLVLGYHRALYLDHRNSVVPADILPLYAYVDFESVLRQDVDGLLARAGCVVLIAEQEGRPVGYITGRVEHDARRVMARRGVVEDWYVEEAARGRGVGRALIDVLIDTFRREGCTLLESSTWASNEGARRAHRRLGFDETQIQFRKRI